MKRRSDLELIKSFVDRTYSSFGMRLVVDVDSKNYDPMNPSAALGYCFKYVDTITGSTVYNVKCEKTGIEDLDLRVMMHEYGHIYLGHLEGQDEELDVQFCKALDENREDLIEEINEKCGIDFADKLLDRVIDDPYLNHSLHNIAMDMEVNSTVLSPDDIRYMEKSLTSLYPTTDIEMLERIGQYTDDEEVKKQVEEEIKKRKSQTLVKLILPENYYLDNSDPEHPVPFPNDAKYAEYFLMIVRHLDQFVKMLVALKMSGTTDTSKVTKQDIQDALNGLLDKFQNQSEAYKQGYRDAMRDALNGKKGNQSQNQQNQSGQGQDQGNDQQSNQQGQSQPGDQGTSDQQGQGQPGGQSTQPGSQQGQGQPGGQGTQSSDQQSQGSGSNAQDDYNQGYQDALRDLANQQGQGQGQGGGMQSLSDLMSAAGMAPGTGQGSGNDQSSGSSDSNNASGQGSNGGSQKHSGTREDPTATKWENYSQDHNTHEREQADKKRSDGTIRSQGGSGCGSGAGSNNIRDVEQNLDDVEMALREVLQNVKKRVVKMGTVKDNMKNYNRGIIRSVIAPSISRKITICNDPKIVYLIDISGSMDTSLIDRCLGTVARGMKKLSHGLKYDIITWNTNLGEHIKDIDPRKPVTQVRYGGGTSIARGIKYFKDNYSTDAILVIISDFEDYLDEWKKVEETMDGYTMWGFDYGHYSESDNVKWKNLIVRKFKNYD